MIALAFTVGVLAGAYGLWAAFKVCDAWRNRPSRRAWRAEQRHEYLARIHELAAPIRIRRPTAPTPQEDTAPREWDDLAEVALPAERTTPLASTAQRYARLRQLPPGRHHAEPSTVGPRRYALPGGAA